MPPFSASATVTAGLKCAPEIPPNAMIKATRAAPVASVLARSARATLPPASRSPMIPEPITAVTRKAVPMNSAVARFRIEILDMAQMVARRKRKRKRQRFIPDRDPSSIPRPQSLHRIDAIRAGVQAAFRDCPGNLRWRQTELPLRRESLAHKTETAYPRLRRKE